MFPLCISLLCGFTKQYRAADGGQPAVIRVRKRFHSMYSNLVFRDKYIKLGALSVNNSNVDHNLLQKGLQNNALKLKDEVKSVLRMCYARAF